MHLGLKPKAILQSHRDHHGPMRVRKTRHRPPPTATRIDGARDQAKYKPHSVKEFRSARSVLQLTHISCRTDTPATPRRENQNGEPAISGEVSDPLGKAPVGPVSCGTDTPATPRREIQN